MASEKILVTGALGQLGTELSFQLGEVFGFQNVILSDIREPDPELFTGFRFETLNVLDQNSLANIVKKHKISQVYHLAAVLSANAERNPLKSWQINLEGSLNVLEIGRIFSLDKVYIPSSIAAFGPHTPKDSPSQYTVMDPNTVYGISKLSAELWGQYYFNRYQLDVRSLRYPGIISYKTLPGGGTTDYAIDIFHQALENESYTCFLNADTFLPMVYMPDAIRATLQLMDAPVADIQVRTSYNLGSMSFSPAQLAQSIQQFVPNFKISYAPDFRQEIADSWPKSIDDVAARQDWGWQPKYDIQAMSQDMLEQLKMQKVSTPAA